MNHNNQEAGTGTAVHFASDSSRGIGTVESLYTDKYDQGLHQSRTAAALRRRGTGGAGMSTHLFTSPAPGPSSSQVSQAPHNHPVSSETGSGPSASVFGAGDLAAAPSVVLGDSQGSVHLLYGQSTSRSSAKGKNSEILSEEAANEVVVGGGLGDSYVDGGARRFGGRDEEEEESMEDGGVLGLLAQIYGRRDGPGVGI